MDGIRFWLQQQFFSFIDISHPDQQTGDINQDGEVNIADAVVLQAFILGRESSCANGTDLNRDGNVDVFDMIALRKPLLK